MESRLDLSILPQPNDLSCGPTCLHAVYGFYGDDVPLESVVAEVKQVEGGGTLAVMLGLHALRRGYDARIYTFNLQVFDPTWFAPHARDVRESLRAQIEAKDDEGIRTSSSAYVRYLELGGRLRFEDLTSALLRRYLKKGVPILTGLSSTYLYRCARETEPELAYDDVRGKPQGHFVVLCGYDPEKRRVLVADPLLPNPVSPFHRYEVGIDRLIGAILLGILTYDANLLIIMPRTKPRSSDGRAADADHDRRQQPG